MRIFVYIFKRSNKIFNRVYVSITRATALRTIENFHRTVRSTICVVNYGGACSITYHSYSHKKKSKTFHSISDFFSLSVLLYF